MDFLFIFIFQNSLGKQLHVRMKLRLTTYMSSSVLPPDHAFASSFFMDGLTCGAWITIKMYSLSDIFKSSVGLTQSFGERRARGRQNIPSTDGTTSPWCIVTEAGGGNVQPGATRISCLCDRKRRKVTSFEGSSSRTADRDFWHKIEMSPAYCTASA